MSEASINARFFAKCNWLGAYEMCLCVSLNVTFWMSHFRCQKTAYFSCKKLATSELFKIPCLRIYLRTRFTAPSASVWAPGESKETQRPRPNLPHSGCGWGMSRRFRWSWKGLGTRRGGCCTDWTALEHQASSCLGGVFQALCPMSKSWLFFDTF